MSEIKLTLPYPPSANKIWRYVGGEPKLSDEAKVYREHVAIEVIRAGNPRLDGRLGIEMLVYPPDNRVRDLDNVQKAILDALEHSRVFENDSQIDEIHVYRRRPWPEGLVNVWLWQLEE
jgi:crossover junction endodeoxyribonuclease RusA